jgi:subtilisin family serine protease
MNFTLKYFLLGAMLMALMVATALLAQENTKIEKLDDLPRHFYRLEVEAVNLLDNREALMDLAHALKTDLESDLKTYDITDKSTLKSYYSSLYSIAILDEEYDAALSYIEMIRQVEDKEALRLTIGLTARAYIHAIKSGAEDQHAAYRSELKRLVEPLPYAKAGDRLKSLKGRQAMLTRNLLIGVIESKVQPVINQTGGLSKDMAVSMINRAYIVNYDIPFKEDITAVLTDYLDSHQVEKSDIWSEREVTLSSTDPGSEVIVTIWDSGLDLDVYKDILWTNDNEIPDNGIDDDNNGFVDDVHGIGYTLHSDKTPEPLYPIGDIAGDRRRLQRLMKGLSDMGSGIDSDEATELKTSIGSMQPQEVQPFFESVGLYGNYAHGTHVAGIAARGNPFTRLMYSRLTFGHTMIPECPSLESSRKDSVAVTETLKYFKENGVRVVNMSWGGDLSSVEQALEANNAGGTPEERKELARQIFEIGRNALFHAMMNTPEILFVTSAGNDDNDVNFEEVIPSNFDFPNIVCVGAVDQAGEETSFTSFGKVDVYANGFEVLSTVPGGDQMQMSGTSQASPNVTNLAAKLLALKPDLTPIQVRGLIVTGADERQVGDRTVRLMNPKKSVELLRNMRF